MGTIGAIHYFNILYTPHYTEYGWDMMFHTTSEIIFGSDPPEIPQF